LKNDLVSWKGNPLYIGEWCLAASASSPNFTDDQLRQYAQVQMDTFQSAAAGWTYWTWKFYNDDGSRNPWSMKDMINRGFIQLWKIRDLSILTMKFLFNVDIESK